MSRGTTRRELVTLLGAGALGRVLGVERKAPAGSVAVAGIERTPDGTIPPMAARAGVGAALAAAVGAASGEAAARRLFGPADTVGIKLSCLAGRSLSPRVELVEALVELVATAGVPRHRIIVFERSSRELERAGFSVRRKGGRYLCYGIDNDYDRQPTVSGGIGSCYARLVSTTCTALVSFGVVKDHDLAGVSAGLKNWYGVIHNPNKYHDNGCDPYIADVVRHPHIAGKLRLTVLDAVTALCHGGPAYRPSGVFAPGVVAASTDRVACDAWAWHLVDAERVRRGMPTLEAAERPPRFIATAEGYGLGVGDLERIRVVPT